MKIYVNYVLIMNINLHIHTDVYTLIIVVYREVYSL